jgi:hypothetical protein
MNNLKEFDEVQKVKGYKFVGTILSVFKNSAGDVRVVVEHRDSRTTSTGGMLHIFSESQLEKVVKNNDGITSY